MYSQQLRHSIRNALGFRFGSLARAGRCGAALVEAEPALGKYRDIPEVRLDVGLVLLICGNPAEALKQFEVAVAIRSEWAEAHAQRGAALAELGRLKDAVAALEAALSFDPEHEGARANLETIRSATG